MYKPLPESLTIKQSGIDGLGLFADQDIKQATNLGMTHFKVGGKIFRTPLGGFINHSNTPNCEKIQLHADSQEPFKEKWNLITRQNIKKGEEIMLHYTFYNV
jgi:SET domain-containing protein